jgi:hypothetical protein
MKPSLEGNHVNMSLVTNVSESFLSPSSEVDISITWLFTLEYSVTHSRREIQEGIGLIKLPLVFPLRWAGHVTRKGEKKNATEFWWESQEERDY